MASAGLKPELAQGRLAYERLIAEVCAGALRPGDRLTEVELAARLGISRTPVREAIRQLEAEGLVVHLPRIGATVRTLDYSEVTELYEMRAVLEGTAARFCARAASEIELKELRAIDAEMTRSACEVHRLYELNRQFHRALLDAARNRFLLKSVEAIEKTLLILGPSTMEEVGRSDEALAEHGALLSALEARDGAAAEDAMRRHIEAAHRARLRQFRSQDGK